MVHSEMSLISLQYYNLPEYHGPPNAFCIELFAVHEDIDERLCSDFLEAAFEVFPELDYCILTVPSQCPTFPLLDNFVVSHLEILQIFSIIRLFDCITESDPETTQEVQARALRVSQKFYNCQLHAS